MSDDIIIKNWPNRSYYTSHIYMRQKLAIKYPACLTTYPAFYCLTCNFGLDLFMSKQIETYDIWNIRIHRWQTAAIKEWEETKSIWIKAMDDVKDLDIPDLGEISNMEISITQSRLWDHLEYGTRLRLNWGPRDMAESRYDGKLEEILTKMLLNLREA